MNESKAANRTWNVTRSGSCVQCGTTQTAIALGIPELPSDAVVQLFSGIESEMPCGTCGEKITNVRVVGVAVRPFVTREDEDDDGISPGEL